MPAAKKPKGATPPGKWRAKLEKEDFHRVVDIPLRMQKQWGSGTMAIPRPLDVDRVMRGVRKGKLITVKQIMESLASEYGTRALCPLTTGIFLRIAAETAEEDRRAGKKRITPYWRTIKSDGKLNEKYPGGAAAQAEKLLAEGFELAPAKGKQPPKVIEFERRLQEL